MWHWNDCVHMVSLHICSSWTSTHTHTHIGYISSCPQQRPHDTSFIFDCWMLWTNDCTFVWRYSITWVMATNSKIYIVVTFFIFRGLTFITDRSTSTETSLLITKPTKGAPFWQPFYVHNLIFNIFTLFHIMPQTSPFQRLPNLAYTHTETHTSSFFFRSLTLHVKRLTVTFVRSAWVPEQSFLCFRLKEINGQTKMILTIPFVNRSSLTPIFRLNNVNDTTMQSVFPHLEPEGV